MVLEVDGKRVIERGDVYYRGVKPPPPPPPPSFPPSQAKTKEGTKEKSETTSANKAKSTTSGPPDGWSSGSGGKQDCGLLGLGCLQGREKVEVAPRREVVFDTDAGPRGVDEAQTTTTTTTRIVTATQSVEPDVITLAISEWETVAPNATVTTTTRTVTSTVTSTASGATSTNGTYDAEEGTDGGDFVVSENDDGNADADADEESGVGFQGLFFRCVLSPDFMISLSPSIS